MNTLNVFPKTYRSISVLGLILSIFSNAIGNDQGGFGSHITYSMPNNLIGVSIYSKWKSGFGIYYELKAGLSGPSTAQDGETFLNISGGLLKRMRPNILAYFGVGKSWRIYSDPPGSLRHAIDPARLNLSGGIIIIKQGSGFLHDLLSYQFGFDARPLGVNVGIGLHFNLPFLKRSK